MSQTTVSDSASYANRVFNAALFTQVQLKLSWASMLTGPAPTQAQANSQVAKVQTDSAYPVVQIRDLSVNAGSVANVDLFDIPNGPPIPGDRTAQGKGKALTFTSMPLKTDMATHVVDAGGLMAQKRVKWNLRDLAKSTVVADSAKFRELCVMYHMNGSAGSIFTNDAMITPDHEDFTALMVNPISAPTRNRHLVADSTQVLLNGGENLATIDTTDVLSLAILDALGTLVNEQALIKPIEIKEDTSRGIKFDRASYDRPIYVLMVSERAWLSLESSAGAQNWRTFLANATARKVESGSNHPLFNREAGMWGSIYVVKCSRSVRWAPGASVNYVTEANRFTGTQSNEWMQTETGVVIPALGAGYTLERCLLIGGQALAEVYGNTGEGDYMQIGEEPYDFKRKSEFAAWNVKGYRKVKFGLINNTTKVREATDFGVIAIDCVAKTPVVGF